MTAKPRRQHNRTVQRLREIERIVKDRWGAVPDTDDANMILDQVSCCLFSMIWKKTGRRPTLNFLADRLKLWCEALAPDISADLCWKVANATLQMPRLDNADTCAARLRLSYEERARLRITTIGAYDADKPERQRRRKIRKRDRDRQRAAQKRLERGAVSREEYLATSLSNTQPWQKLEMSRRTWERHRARARSNNQDGVTQVRRSEMTQVHPPANTSMLGDTPTSLSTEFRDSPARLPTSSADFPLGGSEGPRRGKRAARACPRDDADDGLVP